MGLLQTVIRNETPAQGPLAAQASPEAVLRAAQVLADALAAEAVPLRSSREVIRQLASAGLLTAPLPAHLGGLGWGTELGGQLPLLRLLSIVGSGDLSVGRLYEGHVNALILIGKYGTKEQQIRWAADAANGLLFGVWNTGQPELLRLRPVSDGGPDIGPGTYRFEGGKSFASGAAFVARPVVTAELAGGGWQMTVPRMEAPAMARAVTLDRGSWQPLGMEGSESYTIDFTGGEIAGEDLLGAPGDFYHDPLFRGGAIRFAAVQAGAVLRLHSMFAEWLEARARGEDPYQLARLAEIALGAQEAVLWIERAAAVAEQALVPDADKLAGERMVECANMTRIAIERIATDAMPRIIAGIGAHGLLRPHRFEQILRDLTMYLRQPAPDATLADVGRASLRKSSLFAAGANSGFWSDEAAEGVMAPAYFDRLYQQSADPWSFETSAYEAAKYRDTLDSLPRATYRLVHHTPSVPDYPLTGDQVHALWLARPEWTLVESRRREGYRLDLLERTL